MVTSGMALGLLVESMWSGMFTYSTVGLSVYPRCRCQSLGVRPPDEPPRVERRDTVTVIYRFPRSHTGGQDTRPLTRPKS